LLSDASSCKAVSQLLETNLSKDGNKSSTKALAQARVCRVHVAGSLLHWFAALEIAWEYLVQHDAT
jgi:hypothetical protein